MANVQQLGPTDLFIFVRIFLAKCEDIESGISEQMYFKAKCIPGEGG